MNNPMYSAQHRPNKNSCSMFKKLVVNPLQRLQVEKLRLSFLLRCRSLKRPPPSLRCTGFTALGEAERIILLSEAETSSLNKGIAKKNKEIKSLKYTAERSRQELVPLSKSHMRKWKSHFNKKIDFYRLQENDKWRLWPKKFDKMMNKQKSEKVLKEGT